MAFSVTAGSKIYIGTAAANPDVTAFEADTYTEIVGLMDLGEVGDTVSDVPVSDISSRRVQHLKGMVDGGTTTLVFARDWSDAGQTALRAASKSDDTYNFKIVRNGSGGTTSYLSGLVFPGREGFSNGDAIQTVTFPVAVNSEVLTVEDA